MSHKTKIYIGFTLLLSAACGADMQGEMDEGALADEAALLDEAAIPAEELGSEGDATFRAWTGYTSEEHPPLQCTTGRLIRGVECQGQYCDNIRADCVTAGVSIVESSWTSYFSEEGNGSADERTCAGNEFVTGIACDHDYCDNISLQCSLVTGRTKGACAWSGWFSEESGPSTAPAGRFLAGVECDGSFCDNKRYLYCAAN